MQRLPDAQTLDRIAYRTTIFAFPVFGFGVIFGAIWAEEAWGRYWGWDPKETVSFIAWVVYAAYLHARSTAGWRDKKAAWINVAGFVAMVFNLFFINLVTVGLHSYAGRGLTLAQVGARREYRSSRAASGSAVPAALSGTTSTVRHGAVRMAGHRQRFTDTGQPTARRRRSRTRWLHAADRHLRSSPTGPSRAGRRRTRTCRPARCCGQSKPPPSDGWRGGCTWRRAS